MSDSEFEEPEELRKLTAGRSPTREMREQREIEPGHFVVCHLYDQK